MAESKKEPKSEQVRQGVILSFKRLKAFMMNKS